MGYRREADHARAKAWKRWIAAHQRELEGLGLPLAIYQDAAHWEDFLANGALHWHTDGPPFDFRELPRDRMEQLCDFLEREHAEPPPALLGFLRVRLGRHS